MRRAVDALVQRFVKDYPLENFELVDVVVGPGNNGGDGVGLAGTLALLGYSVEVWRFGDGEGSGDLPEMWQRMVRAGNIKWVHNEAYRPRTFTSVIVDALLGVGTSRPLGGIFAEVVRAVNASVLPVVSIDVPSGQAIDGRYPAWPCIRATHTYTFGAIKFSALLTETGPAWGTPVVLDIDLVPPEGVGSVSAPALPSLLTESSLAQLLAPRERFTHKGTWGHVLVMAGSRGHAGAALLAGRGAYRAGAGLVTFYVPAALESALQQGLPEAMTLTDQSSDYLTSVPDLGPYDSVIVGPGLGKHPRTAAMLSQLFDSIGDKPIVIDADALNLLAEDRRLSAKLPSRAVLTPHPGEFARLVGRKTEGRARLEALQDYVERVARPDTVVVLKDQYTVLAKAEQPQTINFYYGNPGMGTGGMGDVLSGVIGAQLARGLSTLEAARLGVYLHARAGDLAAGEFGERGLLAGDVAEYLGRA